MCGKILAGVIILIAVIVAILACTVSIEAMDNVMLVAKFFDVMLPILAVGALLKYICCGSGRCKCSCGSCKGGKVCGPESKENKAKDQTAPQ